MAEQASLSRSQGGSANLADVLERVLDKGIVIAGDIKLLLADIEVLTLQVRLVICSVDKAKEVGLDWWTNNPAFSPYRKPQEKAPERPAEPATPLERVEERLARIEQSLASAPKVPGR